MERKLRYLEKEIKKDGIPMMETGEPPDAPQPREMIDLEATFEKLENELRFALFSMSFWKDVKLMYVQEEVVTHFI